MHKMCIKKADEFVKAIRLLFCLKSVRQIPKPSEWMPEKSGMVSEKSESVSEKNGSVSEKSEKSVRFLPEGILFYCFPVEPSPPLS